MIVNAYFYWDINPIEITIVDNTFITNGER